MGPVRYGGILWLNQLEKWTIETIYGISCSNEVWAFRIVIVELSN